MTGLAIADVVALLAGCDASDADGAGDADGTGGTGDTGGDRGTASTPSQTPVQVLETNAPVPAASWPLNAVGVRATVSPGGRASRFTRVERSSREWPVGAELAGVGADGVRMGGNPRLLPEANASVVDGGG